MNAVELKKLSFHYPDGRVALKEISLSIKQGSCVALIGPNGAGKSTLLLHLNGILPEVLPKIPQVRIAGELLTSAALYQARQKVGLLFQDPDDQLFCPTVYDDVAFGPRQLNLPEEIVAQRVNRALTQVCLKDFEKRPPQHLSMGEKRRVCLAGVLACEASILALDEPTSGLDPRGRRELKALLQTLTLTKIIATHDLELVVEICDWAFLMDQGALIDAGPPLELLANTELMLAHGLESPHILRHLHPH